MSLKGSKTEQNLKDAFAGESQANRRYLYFAQKADIEGYNDVATVFRSTAEGETGHAHGHLEYLEETGDPATGLPIGSTSDNPRRQLPAKHMNTRTCIRVWQVPRVKKVLTKSLTGSKHWAKQNALMPTGSRKPWTIWTNHDRLDRPICV